ncbi:MAG TPA: hypothetical protein VMX38_06470 [Verrucomicrobiae bacterium]|jgi:hypothetical protein|nr:hypothetical protein [Verrucomicrobiae bacterium]
MRRFPLIAGLLFAILTIPLIAQPGHKPFYDMSKEVTLSGTVSGVLSHPAAGMKMYGSHLLLATASGRIDASLGKWGMAGKGALSVAPGAAVEVTGVMKTIKDQQVFVVRTVKANGREYTIRNEHGIPVSPQSRERLAAQKGESL